MSNEELAIQAQQGNKEAERALYLSVKRLIYKLASRYFKYCAHAHIETDDMLQQCYFGFLQAVRSYPPASELLFTTYLNYPIQNACREALGIRGAKKQIQTVSLDAPIGEDGDITLGDMIEDCNIDITADAELTDLQRAVRIAVDSLPEELRKITRLFYFDNLTYLQIASACNITDTDARKQLAQALRCLRSDNTIKAFHSFYESPTPTYWLNLDAQSKLDKHPKREQIKKYIDGAVSLYLAWCYENSITPDRTDDIKREIINKQCSNLRIS